MAATGDYYRVLGVARDASTLEIRRAYRRLARQNHPDLTPQPDGPERFRALAEAYAVLNHPVRRAGYDHSTRPPARRDTPRATQAVHAHRGVLELSWREAQSAAIGSLALCTAGGVPVVLPVGVADGDVITIEIGGVRAVLTVRVNLTRKDLIWGD
jgi:curved DNA-binding protein CbpA